MKFIKYLFISLGVILVLLLLAPFLFKGKIVKIIKEQANEQLNAKLNFNEDISVGLISSFPNLSISIEDLSLVGIQDFEKDTLFSSKTISLTLDLMSVIKGDKIDILKIGLVQPRIQAFVLKDGRANWDIAKTDTTVAETPVDTSSSAFHVALRKLEITDGYILYDDKEGNMYSELVDMDYTLEGDFTEKLFTMKNILSIQSLTVGMDGINYLSHVNTKANADIEANMDEFKFVFKDNEFSLNQLVFGLNGMFAMPGDDMVMDLTYAAKQNEFKNFLSLIPAIYASDLNDLQSKGKLAFDGFLKGTYNEKQMPSFGLNLGIENGWFKYTSLPTPVENVNVKLAVTNPDGDLDHTEINLSKFHFDIEKNPFDAKLYAKNPMSDPYVDAFFKGVLNLGQIASIVPLPENTKLSGIVSSDITAKGRVSSIENEKYEDFDAKGNLTCTSIYYASPDLPKPFELSKTEMSFSPKIIALKSFDAKIGNSDMQMNGEVANFLPYYFGKGVLKGKLNFTSNQFDANEFLTEGDTAVAATPADTTPMSVFEVPQNIDFTLTSSIKKLLYTNMEITNLQGIIALVDEKVSFKNVSLNTLGSEMKMNGFYETSNPKKPSVDMDFAILNLDFQKAFATFNTVKKLAPAAEHIFGTFSTTLNMKTDLDEHMNPIYPSLFAKGMMAIPTAEIKEIKALDKVADFIKKPEYKKLGFYQSKIKFEVKDGKVTTEPFDVKLGAQTMSLSGTTGLDQTIAYTGKVNIPRKDLGEADKAMSDALALLNSQAGSDIKMNENLPLEIGIGGTFTDPKITTNLADLIKSQAGSLKDQAMDELNKKKKELEDQAKAEADKLKKEAEAKARAEADKLKADANKAKQDAEAKAKAEADKLKAEADKAKKEAEAKAKAEAEKAKKKAAEDAKNKLKGILKP
ncbi:MAG: membrane assembly protein AsmA [Bacteroidia bacterium]|nr:membrane assembly protein AsmA [Bacteroidia bacterium]MCF8427517.1 membrane assembly protein AsmA [Bacteroidia bacterium]MCF8446735.1 membrane assembly protein AsmA [Bacteroidia bacterium]